MHKTVDQTKLALAEEEIGWYLEEFEKYVEEEVLMIGNIGLAEVQVIWSYHIFSFFFQQCMVKQSDFDCVPYDSTGS